MTAERFGSRGVEITHPDRRLFSEPRLTKRDVVDYYQSVAKVFLRHVKDRPLTLHCFPNGIEADGFFRQEVADHFPDWMPAARRERAETSGTIDRIQCDSRPALAFLTNQNTVTFHAGLARAPRLDRCDRIIFDLDPSADDFEQVREAARLTVARFRELGLHPALMTTGSRGLHVMAPVRPDHDHDRVRAAAKGIADDLAEAHPDLLTTAHRKADRGERVYLDFMRIGLGQTAVAPYALRAKPGAPVATPITLEELDDRQLAPRRWHVGNIGRRLDRNGDPWKALGRHAVKLDNVETAIEQKRED